MSWANLPAELRARNQWCIAAPAGMISAKGKEPMTIGVDGRLQMAKSNEPSTWMSFDKAAYYAWERKLHIGYMLNADDPYTCIDFDVKDATNAPDKPESWTTQEQYSFYLDCISRFGSYTEMSVSQKGFHVWVKGKVGRGKRAIGIEIYSQERFMISTGYVVETKEIAERELMLASFIEHIKAKEGRIDYALEELEPEDDDWYVLQTASYAANADKFVPLWQGKWNELGYESQSEADFALLSMLTFYTDSNEQVRRLFRWSALGKRDKATRNNDYINRSLIRIRAREAEERSADLTAIRKSIELQTSLASPAKILAEEISAMQGGRPTLEVVPLHVPQAPPPPAPTPANGPAAYALAAPASPRVVTAGAEGVPWPPGIAGRIAGFVYENSQRPVKEVSIVTALGLLAGICGKAWHIPQSGLNMYITLIAQSGVGKEAMHTAMATIVRTCNALCPQFSNFVMFDDFASGPALTKAFVSNPSFVNVSGEWGKKLRRMAHAEDGRDQAIQTLRAMMTNLYQKSGPQSVVGGIQYSQKDNNTSSVSGVAYSLIGETTPSTFYEALTPEMMEDGFLSRFLSIQYTGERPPANRLIKKEPDAWLANHLAAMAQQAYAVCTSSAAQIGGGTQSMPVKSSEEASQIMEEFELECDRRINSTKDESFRQMWNRAALKALRVAALLAVADRPTDPWIMRDHIVWSIDVVRRDIAIMENRIERGDVGLNDTSRERKLADIIRHYFQHPLPASHSDKETMKANMVIPRGYLQIYAAQHSAFNKDRRGSSVALEQTLRTFCDNGYLVELDKKDAAKGKFTGKAYRVTDLPKWDKE